MGKTLLLRGVPAVMMWEIGLIKDILWIGESISRGREFLKLLLEAAVTGNGRT